MDQISISSAGCQRDLESGDSPAVSAEPRDPFHHWKSKAAGTACPIFFVFFLVSGQGRMKVGKGRSLALPKSC